MITELIIYPFIMLAKLLLSLVPSMDIDVSDSFLNGLDKITQSVGYILPIPALVNAFNIYLSFLALRLAFSIVMRVKSFIPTMGN